MKHSHRHLGCLLAGVAWAVVAGVPAFADDTELFVGGGGGTAAKPNILFIIDNSESMDSELQTQSTYDPNVVYDGTCTTDRVYWRRDTGDPPECAGAFWFDASALKCEMALQAFANGAGRYTDNMAQFDNNSDKRWETIDNYYKSRLIECQDDGGLHGDGSDPTLVYAQSGDASAPWSSDPNDEVAWGQSPVDRVYTVYEGNYLNWFYGPTHTSTRMQVVKDVATALLYSMNGVNVGLMQFNKDQGGPVVHAMEDISTARPGMIDAINALAPFDNTPLAETLYEAGLYYRGAAVDFGNRQGPPNSVDAARTAPGSDTYKSPLEAGCQRNFVVMLTDGEPTKDEDANGRIVAQPNFADLVGAQCDGSGEGHCLDDEAEYLFKADLSNSLPDVQNVVTYTIGFIVDLPILKSTAERGGGEYFTADDTASLSSVLTSIVSSILDTQATFTAPTVSVNSFNRTRNLNDIFVAVFQPSGDTHWPGNLKKYRIDPVDGTIMDANGQPAVDAGTGFFTATSQSFWSTGVDGSEVMLGGAANKLPDPSVRNLYTYLGNSALTNSSNEISTTNGLIDEALLGIGAPGDPTVEEVVDFARGVDVTDIDEDGNNTEPRNQLGDPLHAQPATVIYGGTPSSPDLEDAVVYFATNDGYLHAIDSTTGIEKWAFVPPDFLQDLVSLYKNESTGNKHYGIDGSPTVQILSVNNDGVIDPSAGEKAYLFFGMRRGGTAYYGLDITDPDAPKLLWRLDGSDLPGLGQSWATPVPTRIAVGDGSNQNDDRLALVIAGGYDTTQDAEIGGTDLIGNAIYIVDSVSGNLLWHAGESGADRNLAQMQYSIPADIKVIDLDGDHYADRMYAADMGGQVWRFDIIPGQDPSTLVNGGVIAQLGAAPDDPPAAADSRRFYYAPDAALVNNDGDTFIHIGIGSGHRAHPNSDATQDRFYALRDYLAFGKRTQAEYDVLGASPVTDADLIDITDDVNAVIPAGSAGWKFELRDGGWHGEKVLAEARTFDNKVFFTTFTPGGVADPNSCAPKLGTNRLYVMDILAGRPVTNLDQSVDSEVLTESDRYTEFNGSISSEVVFLFPSPEDEGCVGNQCTPPPIACVDLFCFSPDFMNNPVRTFWSQESAY